MSGFDDTHDDAAWDASPGTATQDWELSAATVELALLRRIGSPLPSLPEALADRIRREAAAHLPRPMAVEARRDLPARSGGIGGRPWRAAAGWWAAACLAGLLCWQSIEPRWIGAPPGGAVAPTTEPRPSLAELRGRLLNEDPEVVKVAWKKAGDDPAVVAGKADLEAADGLGDVVWSPERQQGVMRFRGLAANDPSVAQYQLWIFDAERNAAHPVDGGVFDVPAAADGEVMVRIDPRLPIGRATAFAITVERPGGVVVSSRERLPLIAALP
jgi:hypothetical protein